MEHILTIAGYVAPLVFGLLSGLALAARVQRSKAPLLYKLLRAHFAPVPISSVTVTERTFPARVRVDLQQTIDAFIAANAKITRICGIKMDDSYMFGISLCSLLTEATSAVDVPLQYDEVNIGEAAPVRCLGNTLWLLEANGEKLALLFSRVFGYGTPPQIRIDLATTHITDGAHFTRRFYQSLEESVKTARSYRGKILSLDSTENYTGQETGITVHPLPAITREQVILPAKTLHLLERNLIQFVRQRAALLALGQSVRKGLLFHGAPGNGKTHTIHYLISALQGHTVLLITAEQMGQLAEYMALARLLQPAVVVIEDVDLIARDRTELGSACQESLLNKLLNEMDGLKPDCEIIFLLTTNRPQQLEAALAARPGRVDQAIEFPNPDDSGRGKLIRLYAKSTEISEPVVRRLVERTDGVSAAFIKELVRRTVQFHLARDPSGAIDLDDAENALDELMLDSEKLNRRLLGFAESTVATRQAASPHTRRVAR